MNLPDYAQRKIAESAVAQKLSWRAKKLESLIPVGSCVLDIGCGPATLPDLYKHKNMIYIGLDYNPVFVENGCKKGLDVHLWDGSSELFPVADNSCDVVYCSHVIEHLSTDRQHVLFQEVTRVLKKGGVALFFAPTAYHWYFWDDPTHVRPCTHGQLIHLAVNSGLSVCECRYSLMRSFPDSLQRWLRLPPLRWFLWEVYGVFQK